MLSAILLILVCFANLLLGAFVLANNPKSQINRILAFLSFALIGWSVITFIEDSGVGLSVLQYLAALDFVLASALLGYFYLFCYELSGRPHRWLTTSVIALVALNLAAIATGQTIRVELTGGHVHFAPAWAYPIFVSLAATTLLGGLYLLVKHYRHSQGKVRQQARVILYGLSLAAFMVMLTNVVLPNLLVVSPVVTRLGIYSILIFTGFSVYAIVRHSFLDVRLIVARTVAFTLLLIMLAAIYTAAIFSISGLFFNNHPVTAAQNLIYGSLATVLAFGFQPLRRFFEKLTNRIFYRDSYNIEEVLGKLGDTFASQIDINVIINAAIGTLAEALRPTHAHLVVLDGGRIYRVADFAKAFSGNLVIKELTHKRRSLYVLDKLRGGHTKQLLMAQDISVSLRLVTKEGVDGFLLLGPKESGSIYSGQDLELIETAGPALAVAVQNARSYEKIANFNVTLQKRIEEATTQLRDQNQKLKELDEAKDEFISMASHQLRTPLTAIKGYISMLMEGDAGKLAAKQKDFADLAYMSAQRMVFLIADMLNVSRISTGKLVIDRAPLDLVKVIGEEIKQLERTAEARQVKLEFAKPERGLPLVNLDEGKIRQVIMNFMDNAIYYAPNGTVEIALTADEHKLRFTVTDHGIGVPAKEKEHLFTKFYRAGNAQKVRPDGTGLGLYMAKIVIEMQGGQIVFDSTEGKGSTFGFEFELAKLKVKKAAAKVALPAPPAALV